MTLPNEDAKNLLLAIEEKILEYRDESRRLDQCQRLYDSSALQKGFHLESVRISQELGGVYAAIVREQSSLEGMVLAAKHLMRNAEVAVRSFMMLQHHFSRLQAPALTAGPAAASAPLALSFSPAPSATPQPAPQTGPTTDFYSGIPSKPSPYLKQTVYRFEAQLSEYGQRIEELERLLLDNNSRGENGSANSELSLLQSLPTVMTNVHDFFIHVAAEVESLHQQIETMRTAFIADRHRRGDDSNPFLEADRREVAKREVAAKRVHPTLNAPAMLQLQMPGVASSSSAMTPFGTGSVQSNPFSVQSSAPAFGALTTPNIFSGAAAPVQFNPSTPASTPFGSTAPFSGFSIFGASTPATSTLSLFGGSTAAGSTPASGLFGANTTPSTGLFGASTGGLFGSAATGSLFGNPAQAPAFGATAPTGAAPLFGMGATGAGAAAAKAKPRGQRRK